MNDQREERDAFEAATKHLLNFKNCSFAKNRNDRYSNLPERWAFLGWQAALATKREAQPKTNSELVDSFVELNFANYGDDEVRALQHWAFEAFEHIKALQPASSNIEWASAEAICNLPLVDEAIRGLLNDPTGDAATILVRDVMQAMQAQQHSVESKPRMSCLSFVQRHQYDDWNYNSLASSAQDFVFDAAEKYDEYLQSQPESKSATVTLTGHQMRHALALINPDGETDQDQLDDYLIFGVVKHVDDQNVVCVGLACWNDDTDGVLPLDDEPFKPQSQQLEGCDVRQTARKAFVCTGCEGVYSDQPVSQCDCFPDKNEFVEGTIAYPAIDTSKNLNHEAKNAG